MPQYWWRVLIRIVRYSLVRGACLVGDDRHERPARFPYLPDSDVRMIRAWAMPAEQVSPEHE